MPNVAVTAAKKARVGTRYVDRRLPKGRRLIWSDAAEQRVEAAQEQLKRASRARAAPLDATDRKPGHLGAGPLEHVGAPEVERHRRQLEGDADEDEQPAQDHDRIEAHAARVRLERRDDAGGQVGQVAGAELARQQADAVEHEPARAAAVDDVLQRRLARLPPALEEAGQGVARQLAISTPMKTMSRWFADAISDMPSVAPSSRQ